MININDEENINAKDENLSEEINETNENENVNNDINSEEINNNDNVENNEENNEEVIIEENNNDNDQKLKEANDKYVRLYAEFDNFRKRTQVEKCDMYDKGIIETVSSFLDVIDNFDRALQGFNKNEMDEKQKVLFDGIEMIRGQMDKALNKIGVTAIDAVGEEFNPNIHNAVMHVEDENLGENVVAEELQRGYMYNDKVVRHSMVKVAN